MNVFYGVVYSMVKTSTFKITTDNGHFWLLLFLITFCVCECLYVWMWFILHVDQNHDTILMVFALSTLSFSVKSNQNTDGVLDFYILHEMRIVLVNTYKHNKFKSERF